MAVNNLRQATANLSGGSSAITANTLQVGQAAAEELRLAEADSLVFSIEEQKRKLATNIVAKALGNSVQNSQTLIQAA